MGQCAELSQWKPLFFCPVRMSQMMMACGSSLVSNSGLKVTTYLESITTTHGASYQYVKLMYLIVLNQYLQYLDQAAREKISQILCCIKKHKIKPTHVYRVENVLLSDSRKTYLINVGRDELSLSTSIIQTSSKRPSVILLFGLKQKMSNIKDTLYPLTFN